MAVDCPHGLRGVTGQPVDERTDGEDRGVLTAKDPQRFVDLAVSALLVEGREPRLVGSLDALGPPTRGAVE